MNYRRLLPSIVVVIAAAGFVACLDEGDGRCHGRGFEESSIVFGIDETKGADGKVTTSVGYEMIDVLGHGSRARGVVTSASSCWAENLDDRLGQPHVDGGVAVFRGGLLPANGVAVVANRADDLKLDGPAWTNAGESLTFESKGFVMPDIDPATIKMPSQDLPVTLPADAAAEVALTTAQDFPLSWAASDPAAPPENVVGSIHAVPAGAPPSAHGVELRCFFDRSAGIGTVPFQLLSRFWMLAGGQEGTVSASNPPIKGKLHIATHSQLTIFAKGGWTVYVVATAEQRDQPFSLTP
jgi:hypothetical protein